MRVRNPNPQDAGPVRYLPELLGKGTELSDLYLQVRVNGDVETRRGRQLHRGDVIVLDEISVRIT